MPVVAEKELPHLVLLPSCITPGSQVSVRRSAGVGPNGQGDRGLLLTAARRGLGV